MVSWDGSALSEASLPAAIDSRQEASASISALLHSKGGTSKENNLLEPGVQKFFLQLTIGSGAFQSAASAEESVKKPGSKASRIEQGNLPKLLKYFLVSAQEVLFLQKAYTK